MLKSIKLKIRAVLFSFFVLSIIYFSSFRAANAALVNITPEGVAVLTVLSSQDIALSIPKRESLEVRDNVAGESGKITLSKIGDKISLAVATAEGEKELDVTDYKSELIEVEERPQIQKISISTDGTFFYLKQGEVEATTTLPINVDAKGAEISLVTESGVKFLSILPKSATDSVLKAKIATRIIPKGGVLLTEEGGVLSYTIKGEKVLNLFNVYKYPVPVLASVSASTGEILKTDEPVWLKILGFMFS